MPDNVNLPAGLRHWPGFSNTWPQTEGFELSLLEDCNNAYRFTAVSNIDKVRSIFNDFSGLVPEEAFFILEYYPCNALLSRPSTSTELPAPAVFYSPYLETAEIIETVTPYLERLLHDGFVGFGLSNNRKGLEFFYSEEKVMTFFTDNHLRLSNFLHQHNVRHDDNLRLPSDFGHDHLSLLSFPRDDLPESLKPLSSNELDSAIFCRELVDSLNMYLVEEGLSFFLTRKEQEQIAQLVKHRLPDHDGTDFEFGGLLLDWGDFVNECEGGFEGDLWEYRQGLKLRDTIQMVMEVSPPSLGDKIRSIVAEPDDIFKTILVDRRKRLDPPSDSSIRQERFWYHGVVSNQGSDLRRDLIRNGWFSSSS